MTKLSSKEEPAIFYKFTKADYFEDILSNGFRCKHPESFNDAFDVKCALDNSTLEYFSQAYKAIEVSSKATIDDLLYGKNRILKRRNHNKKSRKRDNLPISKS